MPRRTIPDADRCMQVDRAGRRCRSPHLPEQTLCYYHYKKVHSSPRSPAEHPYFVAARLLPAGASLNSPAEVAEFLTRVMREMVEGHLAPKQASTLSYLCQTVLMSMQKAAASSSAPPPDEASLESQFDNLAAAISSALQPNPIRKPDSAPEHHNQQPTTDNPQPVTEHGTQNTEHQFGLS